MKNLRKFSGTTSAKKEEARMRNDVKEALECGVSSDIANRLLVRGKRHEATLPNINYGDIVINRGHDKKYGVRPEKKKNIDRKSIRENPLTDEDFYDEYEI